MKIEGIVSSLCKIGQSVQKIRKIFTAIEKLLLLLKNDTLWKILAIAIIYPQKSEKCDSPARNKVWICFSIALADFRFHDLISRASWYGSCVVTTLKSNLRLWKNFTLKIRERMIWWDDQNRKIPPEKWPNGKILLDVRFFLFFILNFWSRRLPKCEIVTSSFLKHRFVCPYTLPQWGTEKKFDFCYMDQFLWTVYLLFPFRGCWWF